MTSPGVKLGPILFKYPEVEPPSCQHEKGEGCDEIKVKQPIPLEEPTGEGPDVGNRNTESDRNIHVENTGTERGDRSLEKVGTSHRD